MANARKVARKPFHLMAKPTGPPEGLGLRRADAHSERLSPAVAVDADGDEHRNRDDPPLRVFT
ncbi:MAG: hypothetical protein H6R00_1591 [Proteobacteria bacterium]|nr:hypothetical protein [Pseudomonadota bacterium]